MLSLKILLTTIYTYPQQGGLGTYVSELKKGLESLGHEVDVLAAHPDYSRYYTVNDSWFIEKRELGKMFLQREPSFSDTDPWILKSKAAFRKFAIVCERLGLKRYDLIHAQDVTSARAAVLVKPDRTPLVTTIHGCTCIEKFDNGEIERHTRRWEHCVRMDYKGIVSSDMAIVPSQWLKGVLLKECSVPANRLAVIPNGMDVASFLERMEKKSDFSEPPSRQVIVCIARLVKDKGHKYLLYALAKLLEQRQDWICWLIGDGDLRTKLNRLRDELGLQEHVVFMGKREDVPALMKRADVAVLPSLNENCPYVVMEAQVAGKVMIASDAGGIPEMIVHGETGLLAPARKVKPLYQQLLRVLEDRALRHHIEVQSRQWGRDKWSIDRMVSQTLSLYHKVLR